MRSQCGFVNATRVQCRAIVAIPSSSITTTTSPIPIPVPNRSRSRANNSSSGRRESDV
ncbi:GM22732 [Drosophila sechellia]|uniref:GM22732 n=1 Tax=Drosophila sechellia TaxID=7238 RepID=B4I770_DROSE|nr:GM22732 [Drosophila sechellia]